MTPGTFVLSERPDLVDRSAAALREGDGGAAEVMQAPVSGIGCLAHPTDLAISRGARLVTATETERGRSWAEAKIKQRKGEYRTR